MSGQSVTTYQCGTLTYTLPRLFFVLFWVVIGSAVIAVGTQLPSIMLPIQLKDLGVSETAKVFLLTTIGQVLNMSVCPYIGVASDWHRGKWGRRIPYIFLSTPPIVLALVLFGLSNQIGNRLSLWTGYAPVTMTMVALALVMILFQFFNMWVNSVIWYIFNDIIPVKFFGASMAAFKLGMTAGPSLFQYFFFKHVNKHPTALYLGVAALYFVGVMLFCLFVKEGEYPPLTAEQLAVKAKPWDERLGEKVKGLGNFIKESFCGKIYIYRYLFQISIACSSAAFIFMIYLSQELGLTNEMIGRLNGLNGIISTTGILVVSVLAAEVVSRWHPMRVEVYFYFFNLTTAPLLFRWLFGTLPPAVYLWMGVVNTACMLVISGLNQICSLPSQMLLFPKSRFGSFCSMQALLRSTCVLLISIVVGGLLDLLKSHYAAAGNEAFAYRYVGVWAAPWHLLTVILGFLLYREWGRRGGQRDYAAPACWEPSGKEPLEALPVKPISPKALLNTLWAIDLVFLLFTLLLPFYALWHCRWRLGLPLPPAGDEYTFLEQFRNHLKTGGEPQMLWQYLLAPGIVILVADTIWLRLRLRLAKQAKGILEEKLPNNGLLHPGMALVIVLTCTAQCLNALCANTFASQTFGRTTNTLVAITLLILAAVLTLLAKVEQGLPQPPQPS